MLLNTIFRVVDNGKTSENYSAVRKFTFIISDGTFDFGGKRRFNLKRSGSPYVILKWAMTCNGYMDIDRQQNPAGQYWITNHELKTIVHQWRSEEDAILVGYNTMVNDKPQLTTRLFPGKDPQRYVCQRNPENSESDY